MACLLWWRFLAGAIEHVTCETTTKLTIVQQDGLCSSLLLQIRVQLRLADWSQKAEAARAQQCLSGSIAQLDMPQYGLMQHSTAQHTQISTPDRTTVSLLTAAVVNEYAVSWAPPLLLALLLSTAVMLKARALFSDDATKEEFITRSATLQNLLWSNRPRRLAASPGSPYKPLLADAMRCDTSWCACSSHDFKGQQCSSCCKWLLLTDKQRAWLVGVHLSAAAGLSCCRLARQRWWSYSPYIVNWTHQQHDRHLLLLDCKSRRLPEAATAAGATSVMSPETPNSALRVSVSNAESEVVIARV
jgi:hypothetical protein